GTVSLRLSERQSTKSRRARSHFADCRTRITLSVTHKSSNHPRREQTVSVMPPGDPQRPQEPFGASARSALGALLGLGLLALAIYAATQGWGTTPLPTPTPTPAVTVTVDATEEAAQDATTAPITATVDA